MTRAGLWILAVCLAAVSSLRVATAPSDRYDARLMSPAIIKPVSIDGL